MMIDGWARATLLVFCALTLASCAATIADNLPVWAGGLPAGVPPRPGTPEYEEYRQKLIHPQAAPANVKGQTATKELQKN